MQPARNWTDQTPLIDSSLRADGGLLISSCVCICVAAALPPSRTPTSSCCWSDLASRYWINHITRRCHLSHLALRGTLLAARFPTRRSALSNLSPPWEPCLSVCPSVCLSVISVPADASLVKPCLQDRYATVWGLLGGPLSTAANNLFARRLTGPRPDPRPILTWRRLK